MLYLISMLHSVMLLLCYRYSYLWFDENEDSCLSVDAICVLFPLSSLFRLSSMSVVFDFNASLNDFAPLSPMLFPVGLM